MTEHWKARKVVVSAFTEAEVEHQAKLWGVQGYKPQGKMETTYLSFQEVHARVSRMVHLQLLIKEENNDSESS